MCQSIRELSKIGALQSEKMIASMDNSSFKKAEQAEKIHPARKVINCVRCYIQLKRQSKTERKNFFIIGQGKGIKL